jgi:hypothetical protein
MVSKFALSNATCAATTRRFGAACAGAVRGFKPAERVPNRLPLAVIDALKPLLQVEALYKSNAVDPHLESAWFQPLIVYYKVKNRFHQAFASFKFNLYVATSRGASRSWR